MSLSVTASLPSRMRQRLEESATQQRRSPDDLIMQLLESYLGSVESGLISKTEVDYLVVSGDPTNIVKTGPYLLPSGTADEDYTLPKEAATKDKESAMNTPEVESRRFRFWADSHRRHVPVIPLEAMSREHIYEDRG